MALQYEYVALPKVWPGRQRPDGFRRIVGPFKVSTWSPIERFLLNELAKLGARDIVLAIDMPKPQQWNTQGKPRSDARANSPAVIVSFTRRDGVRLTFPCDTYTDWQTNVYAIAKSLENLRAVDRYGVTQGDQQYVGFRALPPGGNGSAPAMSDEEAATIIAEFSELPDYVILAEPSVARLAIRTAKGKSHPDADGQPGDFERVTTAAVVIERLHQTAD